MDSSDSHTSDSDFEVSHSQIKFKFICFVLIQRFQILTYWYLWQQNDDRKFSRVVTTKKYCFIIQGTTLAASDNSRVFITLLAASASITLVQFL